MVVVLGIDVHKNTHTAVAVDEVGRKLGEQTVRATDSGHRQLLRWALRNWPEAEVVFAVEDCRHVSTRLERALLAAGQAVVRVPPKLMAGARSSARTRGKSDPIDASAIARATPREPDLPTATHDEASREVKLLVDHREDMIGTRTRMQNRLRRHLHELDPELDPAARSLDRRCELDRLTTWPAQQPASMVMRIAAELVTDIRDLTVRINASEACYAMHAGVAPIPASSGNTNRHRPARGGNRQLNAALHRIAVTQIRLEGPGRDYIHRHRTPHSRATRSSLT